MELKFKNFELFLVVFWKKVGLIILLIPFFFIDGSFLSARYSFTQEVLVFLSILTFLVFYKRARKRVKGIFICVLLFSPLVEYTMSLGFDMYTYRKGNVPLFVFFMHAICISRLFEFSREKIVLANKVAIINWLYLFFAVHTLSYYFLYNDVFGLVMSLGVLVVFIIRPKYQLMFLTYHFVITFAEYFGVLFEVWYWPKIAFDTFSFLPSHNPPSGISLFYYILELGAFMFYIIYRPKVWNRFKRIKSGTKP